MAILDSFPQVEVTIEVNGQPLQEHRESDLIVDPPRRTLRYVEASNDDIFEIVLTVKKGTVFRGDCIAFDVHVDGDYIGGPIFWKGSCDDEDNTDADRTLPKEDERLVGIGTILVTFQDCRRVREVKETLQCKKKSKLDTVSEKAVKGRALSHSIEYATSEPRADEAVKIYKTTPVDPQEEENGIEFRYRSLASLRALHIIPMPPSLEERDVTTLSTAEVAELQRRVRDNAEWEERALKIKRERGSPGLTVRVGDRDVELVDLTED
ncbi:uncharacterized protein MYCGRDRAFT_96992 [Zymoseptoria tritici IPO323]|uniref:DUF7918 domain-containing protein n=1 Tax=Zymoseptoria tritici (strain CBS 115943 / IPO323) TaxID=336722 RepID=F9XNJ8_ZYMTI|nr:uncharacterized protein MYCGRDRAFT_96992 [Zymoseptoria tritici IPO323]EGP82882.1 hypothetical protein MYCGRDRAFT_96992 [Zymoseptoria tritici IPO323]